MVLRTASGRGYPCRSETAIVPVLVGDEEAAMEISRQLQEEGYFIPAIRYPTVRKGEAILRVALMATHTREELAGAARAIGTAVRQWKRNEKN